MHNKVFLTIYLIIIIFSSLSIRLYHAIGIPEKYKGGLGVAGDALLYHNLANNLFRGNGFSATPGPGAYGYKASNKKVIYKPAITRSPVYPYFLSTIYKLFGNPDDLEQTENWPPLWNKVRIVQCILDTLTCVMVFFLIRIIFPNSMYPALIGPFLYVYCFQNIYYSKALISETQTCFLLTTFLLAFALSVKYDKYFYYIISGCIFALLSFARKEYGFYIFFLLIYLTSIYRPFKLKAFKIWGILFAITVMIHIPWTVRNYVTFGKPIVVYEGNFGYSLFYGTFMSTHNVAPGGKIASDAFESKLEWQRVDSLHTKVVHYMNLGEIQVLKYDDELKRMAVERIINKPFDAIKNWIRKVPLMWTDYYFHRSFFPDLTVHINFMPFYFLFAMTGLIGNTNKEYLRIMPILLLLVYITLLYFPLFVDSRLGVPLLPGIICLASIGIYKSFVFIKSRIFRL